MFFRHAPLRVTSGDLAREMTEAVEMWKLERATVPIPVTTDNARNIVNAVGAAGLGPQIGCFAHVINLASQKAMAVQQISRLLAKIRKIVTFFHRSPTVLKTKQELLQLTNSSKIYQLDGIQATI